jgi:hypothetical protein
LNLEGQLVAVNAANLPEYGGLNLGVPLAEVVKLMSILPPDYAAGLNTPNLTGFWAK